MQSEVARPLKSQMVVDTSPTDALAPAPNDPTMAASMYCITMLLACASMEGMLNVSVSRNPSFKLRCLWSRILPSRRSFLSIIPINHR